MQKNPRYGGSLTTIPARPGPSVPVPHRIRCSDRGFLLWIIGSAFIVVLALVVFVLSKRSQDEKRRAAQLVAIVNDVDAALHVADEKMESFDFSSADAALVRVSEQVENSTVANRTELARMTGLAEKIAAARTSVSNRRRDYERKTALGYKVLNGMLTSPSEIQERERENALRAQQERAREMFSRVFGVCKTSMGKTTSTDSISFKLSNDPALAVLDLGVFRAASKNHLDPGGSEALRALADGVRDSADVLVFLVLYANSYPRPDGLWSPTYGHYAIYDAVNKVFVEAPGGAYFDPKPVRLTRRKLFNAAKRSKSAFVTLEYLSGR